MPDGYIVKYDGYVEDGRDAGHPETKYEHCKELAEAAQYKDKKNPVLFQLIEIPFQVALAAKTAADLSDAKLREDRQRANELATLKRLQAKYPGQ